MCVCRRGGGGGGGGEGGGSEVGPSICRCSWLIADTFSASDDNSQVFLIAKPFNPWISEKDSSISESGQIGVSVRNEKNK